MSKLVSERDLVIAWHHALVGPLFTTDGRRIDIIYRGQCPGGAGPDIRGALIAFNGGTLVEGAVEFHRRTSDWFSHHHHDDPLYQGVILHIVLEADVPGPRDALGEPIPTLVLSEPRSSNGDLAKSVASCHRLARQRPREEIEACLDQLGDRRLIEHAARIEADLSRLSVEQVAYQSLFDVLGFSRNRAAFVRLAETVPIAYLTATMGQRPPGEALDLVEAILLGVAGLLPSQRSDVRIDRANDATVDDLENVWELFRRDWDGLCLKRADWVFGGVRPMNYPTRRLAAAAQLLVRHRDSGLDQSFLAPLRRGDRLEVLIKLFVVDDSSDYWSTHADFGHELPRGQAALLGRDRARDTVVNLVLPLALAVESRQADPRLVSAAWHVYHSISGAPTYQAARNLAVELGIADKRFQTARQQQGLLYLARYHCERGACFTCPLADQSLEPVEPIPHRPAR